MPFIPLEGVGVTAYESASFHFLRAKLLQKAAFNQVRLGVTEE